MQQAYADPLPPLHIPGFLLLAVCAYVLSSQWQALEALSTFGIANALMLGLLAKFPRWREWNSYACIAAASALSHWLGGSALADATLKAFADTAGVAIGVTMLSRLPLQTLQLRRESSPMLVLLACLAASVTTTVLGLPAQAPLFDSSLPKALALAVSTELMNHVLVVPLVLSFRPYLQWQRLRWTDALPLAALLASELLATLIGGPGAIAFTLPAFIWCALRFPLYITATVFAMFTFWKCQAFAMGHSSMTTAYFANIISLRVGLSLLWLGPLTVACSQAARNDVLRRLNYASQHDHLTHTLVRATFMQRSEAALELLRTDHGAMAVLMLDIDHFKQVNDQHGHAMGDTVLQSFASTVKRMLRQSDLMGRYGGEEFCVCLPGVSEADALVIAERLRAGVLALPFTTAGHEPLHVTVSIGMAYYASGALPESVSAALAQADTMLYRAKTGGRNRVEHCSFAALPSLAAAMAAPHPAGAPHSVRQPISG